MIKDAIFTRHYSDEINMSGIECVPEDLFIKCYNKAIICFEQHGVDVSEHHGYIINSLCSGFRAYYNRTGDREYSPSAYVQMYVHTKVHNFKEDEKCDVHVDELQDFYYTQGELSDWRFIIEDVLCHVYKIVGERNFNIWYDYAFRGDTYASISREVNLCPDYVRQVAIKVECKVLSVLRNEYPDIYKQHCNYFQSLIWKPL